MMIFKEVLIDDQRQIIDLFNDILYLKMFVCYNKKIIH